MKTLARTLLVLAPLAAAPVAVRAQQPASPPMSADTPPPMRPGMRPGMMRPGMMMDDTMRARS